MKETSIREKQSGRPLRAKLGLSLGLLVLLIASLPSTSSAQTFRGAASKVRPSERPLLLSCYLCLVFVF